MNPREDAKLQATMAAQALRSTLDATPDDRAMWSPSETARSAAQIVAHCALANHAFAAMAHGESPLPLDAAEAMKQINAGGRDIESRDAAMQALDESIVAFHSAMESLSDADLAKVHNTPFGPLPTQFFMTYPAQHMKEHARQIDYIQTIWGDLDNHAQ